ncbi:MAG TPA: AAA family ATPase [Anaerolineae bacterium]|nr:AAA family ATPase [Anaerolineae bacterium]
MRCSDDKVMTMLRVRLFGGLEVRWGDVALPTISGTEARSLFAYLLTYRDRPHTRNLLAGTFWPELPDAAARQRLRQGLWQIRRALSPHPVLLAEGDTVQVNPALPIWLDVERFGELTGRAAGRRGDQPGAPTGRPAELEGLAEAVALYRGDFLAGYYDDWVIAEQERLREVLLGALERLVAGHKGRGDYQTALTHARRLASADPWREEAHREVMRLCHVLGRDAEALKQYEVCRRVLADGLGIEPLPETDGLAAEISERAGLQEPPWAPVAAHRGRAPLLDRPDRLPLVGREAELAELLSRVEAAAGAAGGLVLVYGEAGVGKTRLLRELERNARWRGMQVAWGRCADLSGSPAYGPLLEVLRTGLPLLGGATIEPLWRTELARLLPELASGTSAPPLDPEQERHRLLEAIARGFLALAHATPRLILLEDAHWMDADSLSAIRYLLPRLESVPELFVITARGEELTAAQASALAALERTRLPRRLELRRLNLAESGELVRLALGLERPAPRFAARLFAETEGNPFFLTETLRELVDVGLLSRDGRGEWSTPWDESTQDYAEMPLPDSVLQSIKSRLERLPAPQREALDLAAVIGRGVPFDLWHQSSDRTATELLSLGDELRARALLLSAGPGMAGGADYFFAHDLIRRVTYEQLAGPRRRLYHRRVAEALTLAAAGSRTSASPGTLAYHWTAAQVWDKAAACHQEAGDRARAVYANADAVAHYTQALEALARLPAPVDLRRSFDLRLAREQVFGLQGARQAQIEELAALAELAEALGDDQRRAGVALRRARLAELTSDFPPAIAAARLAVRLAQTAGDVTVETESLLEWGWALLLQGEHAASGAQFGQALDLARRAGLLRQEADALHGLGTVCLTTAHYADAEAYFLQVLTLCRQVDIRPREASTLANLGYIATARGDHAASKAYGQRALRIHQEIGDQRGAAIVLQNLSDELLAEGDFGAARSYLEQALAIQRAIQAQENVGVSLRSLGTLFDQLGDYSRAGDYYRQALDLFGELGIPYYRGQALAYLSLLSHHLGDDRAAREESLAGLAVAREIGDRLGQGWLLDSLGHALAGLGDLDEAAGAYRQALALRQQLDEAHLAAESLAGLARVALLQADLSAAAEWVEEILHIDKTRGLGGANEPFQIWLTCYRVLEAGGDTRADEVLVTAHERLQQQGSTIHDEALKRSFLENVAAHREIVAAYCARQSARAGTPQAVRLPRNGSPLRRPLGDDAYVAVAWTPDAPEDAGLPSAGDRRRQRLLRLLRQAAEQGAAPTVDDLAQALKAGAATVKRDLAALRRQGHQVRTRGSPR